MKKFKYLIILLLLVVISSCSGENPQDVTDLIVRPKSEQALLKGTWEVSEIKETSSNNDNTIKVGDQLYINDSLVAYNNDYAFPPKFTSKYVELASYLASRGIDLKVSDQTNVIVLNASQGQLFSKDFVSLNDKEIFFVLGTSVVILEKVSNRVADAVIENYSKRASKERTMTTSGEAVEEDITILLGVRERIDIQANDPNYYYYTYCIRIEPNKMARIEKAENIYFPKGDEFWRFKASINSNTGKYDNFWAYPLRLEAEIGNDNIKNKYSFINDKLNMRFNFINQDYISFDYTVDSDNSPLGKYAMVKTDELDNNKLLKVSDYTGEENSNQIFKNIVYEEVVKNFGNLKEDEIEYDYTNYGIVRNQGLWVFQTSYQIDKDGTLQQKSFPIDIAMRDNSINSDNSTINIDQVRNINNQEKDYFELFNNQYVAIQSSDELLFYKINNGYIELTPRFNIQLNNPTQVVMFEQGLGSYAEKWEKSFNDNNLLIR